tara:strand:+ start:2359 stop:2748 length:390 start_codon:yes stop_codon:yes gene_type:complete
MDKLTVYATPLGRLFLAFLFIMAGISKAGNPEGTIGYISSAGLPLPELGYAIALAAELGGGLLILVGYKTRIIAPLMALFTIATAVFFHNNFADQVQQIMFMKNFAIAGGFLVLGAHGAGALSIDNRKG